MALADMSYLRNDAKTMTKFQTLYSYVNEIVQNDLKKEQAESLKIGKSKRHSSTEPFTSRKRHASSESSTSRKRHTSSESSTSRKRHASLESLSFEEIKTLSPKCLVEKFAEFIPDEMSRRYSYQCRLLPGKCNMTYNSYGNEQKAWDQIKVHLISHLNQQKSGMDVSVLTKTPPSDTKPTCSNSVQKSPKKVNPGKKSQTSSDQEIPAKSESSLFAAFRIPQTCKSNSFPAKKILEFNGVQNAKPLTVTENRERIIPKRKCRQPRKLGPHSHSRSLSSTPKHRSNMQLEEGIDDNKAGCSSQCDNVKSDISLPSNRQKKDISSSSTSDHSYATFGGVKPKIPEEQPAVYVAKRRRKYQKQFIITTPKFPYLHAPEPYVVTEITEIDEKGNAIKRKQYENVDCLDIPSYIVTKTKEENILSPSFTTPILEKQNVTGLVLECVENTVNNKRIGVYTSKNKYSSSENVENMEDLKEAKKKKALKLIEDLQTKKKESHGVLECQICDEDKQFTALASLVSHYRGHAGFKPFVCTICNDTFTRQHSLNYHVMIHNNESRFSCEFCARTFRHPSHYREHLRRHTGETPFECPYCNMQFRTRNTFKRHLKIQHKKVLTPNGIQDLPSPA